MKMLPGPPLPVLELRTGWKMLICSSVFENSSNHNGLPATEGLGPYCRSDPVHSTVKACFDSKLCPPTASFTVSTIVYSPGRVFGNRFSPICAATYRLG